MKMSVSLARDFELYNQKHFETLQVSSILFFARMMSSRVWSQLIWKDGVRLSENFLECHYLALDFDDGKWSLQDAVNFCQKHKYAHIIGTTKSHQIVKGTKPACDRFRMVIPWESVITDSAAYRHNMSKLAKKIPIDTQALDLARSFLPCRDIISYGAGGKMAWSLPPPPRKKPVYVQSAGLPSHVLSKLKMMPPEGERNKHTFTLAMMLAAHGMDERQVIDHVLSAPIELSKREKIDAAKSGYKVGVGKREPSNERRRYWHFILPEK